MDKGLCCDHFLYSWSLIDSIFDFLGKRNGGFAFEKKVLSDRNASRLETYESRPDRALGN
jgi:hypothetical protein